MSNQLFKLVNDISLAASSASNYAELLNYDSFSVHVIITGAPVGTLKLQSSNDGVNWEDVPDSSYAVSAAVTVMYNCVEQEYAYFRLSYTRASGSGTINAFATLKG